MGRVCEEMIGPNSKMHPVLLSYVESCDGMYTSIFACHKQSKTEGGNGNEAPHVCLHVYDCVHVYVCACDWMSECVSMCVLTLFAGIPLEQSRSIFCSCVLSIMNQWGYPLWEIFWQRRSRNRTCLLLRYIDLCMCFTPGREMIVHIIAKWEGGFRSCGVGVEIWVNLSIKCHSSLYSCWCGPPHEVWKLGE